MTSQTLIRELIDNVPRNRVKVFSDGLDTHRTVEDLVQLIANNSMLTEAEARAWVDRALAAKMAETGKHTNAALPAEA